MATSENRSDQEDRLPPPPAEPPSQHVPALRPTHIPPARKLRWWRWAAAGFLALALALFASTQIWLPRSPAVAVEIAALAPVSRVLTVNGRIAATNSAEIRASASGRLVALSVDEGDLVQAGQLLAQVDDGAQTAAVRQAMASLDAALVGRQQAEATYERNLALGSNIPRADLDAAERALQSATQDVARMTAALDQARALLETYTVRAPMSGSILTLDAQVGQLVGPSTALLTLADLDDLVVEADVDETYATQISPGQAAVLQRAGETATHDGHVSFVSSRVDEATGGLAIKIAFDTPVTAPIGMTVATNIIVDQRAAALTVPRTALLANGAETAVLVVRDGAARRQPLTLVDWPAARLIVETGLAEGDAVIVDPTGITDGQAVTAGQP